MANTSSRNPCRCARSNETNRAPLQSACHTSNRAKIQQQRGQNESPYNHHNPYDPYNPENRQSPYNRYRVAHIRGLGFALENNDGENRSGKIHQGKFFITKVENKKQQLVYGFGVNDMVGQCSTTVNGKQVICDFYLKCKDMFRRCYGDNTKYYDNYDGCIVDERFKLVSEYNKWFDKQDTKDKVPDKDLLHGNLYSPDTVLFVTTEVNVFIIRSDGQRSNYPIGVTFH